MSSVNPFIGINNSLYAFNLNSCNIIRPLSFTCPISDYLDIGIVSESLPSKN